MYDLSTPNKTIAESMGKNALIILKTPNDSIDSMFANKIVAINEQNIDKDITLKVLTI